MLNVKVPKGKYVVAVSGGVDSMALLDLLRHKDNLDLVVAHANHGLRPDADQDENVVRAFAKRCRLPFIAKKLHLPAHSSEAQARKARYDFLQHCRKEFAADAIITAHHQDDLIETVIINFLRGTGWRGLAPFGGQSRLLRPLLDTPKDELIAYARKHHLPWREDSTNADETYLRNYVRHTLIPYADQKSDSWRRVLLQHIRKQQILRHEIDTILASLYSKKTAQQRYWFIMAPHVVGIELVKSLLREATGQSVVQELAESALLFTKTAFPHKIMPINRQWQLRVTVRQLIVEPRVGVIR